MSPAHPHPVWPLLARKSMVWAGLLATAAALAYAAWYAADMQHTSLLRAQAQRDGQQAELAQKMDDLAHMQTQLSRYRRLEHQGLLGTPQRSQWVEQLQAIGQELGFADPWAYTLAAPQPLAAGATTEPEPADATAQSSEAPQGPYAHDLTVDLPQSHEDDVWYLLTQMQARAHGRFRVQSCQWSEPQETGAKAQCVLRFVSLPVTSGANDRSPTSPSAMTLTPAAGHTSAAAPKTRPVRQTAPALASSALGTLIYTPAQRQAINRQRWGSTDVDGNTAAQRWRLDGLVRRAGGKSTVWVNGKALPANDPQAPRLTPQGAVVQGTPLRVGQSVEATTQGRSDVVPSGSVRVRPAP